MYGSCNGRHWVDKQTAQYVSGSAVLTALASGRVVLVFCPPEITCSITICNQSRHFVFSVQFD